MPEVYCKDSKLRDRDIDYVVKTTGLSQEGVVTAELFVNGVYTEAIRITAPDYISDEEIPLFLEKIHKDKFGEIEALIKGYHDIPLNENSDEIFKLGMAFKYKRLFAEAVEMLERVTRLEPGNHQAYKSLADTHLCLGQSGPAFQAATKAVEYRPGFADYRNTLGEAYLANNDYENAIAEFQQAISINMYYANAYLNLALANISQTVNVQREHIPMMTARANDCLKKALMIENWYSENSEFQQAIEYLEAGDIKNSIRALKALRENYKEHLRSQFVQFHVQAVILPEQHLTQESLQKQKEWIKEKLETNPGYVDLQFELAQVLLQQSRLLWFEGIAQLETVTKLNPQIKDIDEIRDVSFGVGKTINETLDRFFQKGTNW